MVGRERGVEQAGAPPFLTALGSGRHHRRRMASSRGQLRLFDSGPPPLGIELARQRARGPSPDEAQRSSSQLLLFTDRIVLTEALGRAVISADYEEAARIECQLCHGWGEDAVPAELRFVRRLGPDFWERSTEPIEALEGWSVIECSVRPGGSLWRRVRNGFFARLLSVHSAEAVVGSQPTALRLVVGTLMDGEAVADARRLVRDALLAGESVDLEGVVDPPLTELLAEDLDPRWLASLGAIRGLWPLPRPTPGEVDAIANGIHHDAPPDEQARAMAFWDTLRLAELRGAVSEPLLHAARKRLKLLNVDLHALYMDGTGPFAEVKARR